MQVNVTFRNMDPDEGVKEFVERKVQRLKRLLNEPIDIRVVLESDKFRYHAEVVVSADGLNVIGRQTEEDLRAAVDLVMDKVERQVAEQKKKERQAKRQAVVQEVVTAEGGPEVVQRETYPLKPMSVAEALREVEGREEGFVLFINEETEAVNLLYKKKDGGYGLLELEA